MLKNKIDLNEQLHLKWEIVPSKLNIFYTKAHYFLMPLLSINSKSLEFGRHYVNSFLDDELRPVQLKNCVLLLFKTTEISTGDPSITWDKLRSNLESNENYRYHYYVGNNTERNQVIYVFKIPEIYQKDYVSLLDSSYSKTSDFFKRKIVYYFEMGSSVRKVLNGILYKIESFRKSISEVLGFEIPVEQEYWDEFMSSREIFRHNIK